MQGSKLYGVELDSITGRIAKQLYPEANITVAGFETTNRPGFFDLAVGNVPFGQYQVHDPEYDRLGFSIHNYFAAKMLDQVRPGGIVAFVTSRYTLDAKDESVRRYLAERGELLGAIRLPNNAFRANAGTDVVSDIIFLQKREAPATELPDWVHVGTTPEGFTVNRYFIDHPDLVLGTPTAESTQYGRQDYTVAPIEGADLSELLHEAVQNIHGEYTEREMEEAERSDILPADPDVRNYSFTLVDGEVYYREGGIMVRQDVSAAMTERIKGLMELRDCTRKLIQLQTEDASDAEIAAEQRRLNRLYDAYTAKHGLISSRENKRAFSDDSSYYLLCSLEILDEDGKLERKADMFTRRTIQPHRPVERTETAAEALAVSLNELGRVDMEYMSRLCGKSETEIAAELSGVIFRVPGTERYVTADEYLSGNVREKLREAEAAAKDDASYSINVEALKQMAQTINFLKENGDMDFDELSRRAEAASEKCSALTEKLKATEARMSEVEELKKQVINYLRTLETFRAYKASGYSKRYLAEHEQEILLHRAAKKAFNDLGLKKLPTVKALQAEYAALLADKRAAYPAYREARAEMKKLLTYRANAEAILGGKECIANTPSKYGHR